VFRGRASRNSVSSTHKELPSSVVISSSIWNPWRAAAIEVGNSAGGPCPAWEAGGIAGSGIIWADAARWDHKPPQLLLTESISGRFRVRQTPWPAAFNCLAALTMSGQHASSSPKRAT